MRTAAVLVALLVGCGGAPAAPRATPPAPALAPPHLVAIEAAPDLDGVTVGALPSDQRATIAIVFASWCTHCRDELPVLAALLDERPDLRMLGINYRAHEEYDGRGDAAAVRALVASDAPWLRVVPADDAVWASLGRPPKVPTLFIFDRDGALVRRFDRQGARLPTLDELRAALPPAPVW